MMMTITMVMIKIMVMLMTKVTMVRLWWWRRWWLSLLSLEELMTKVLCGLKRFKYLISVLFTVLLETPDTEHWIHIFLFNCDPITHNIMHQSTTLFKPSDNFECKMRQIPFVGHLAANTGWENVFTKEENLKTQDVICSSVSSFRCLLIFIPRVFDLI